MRKYKRGRTGGRILPSERNELDVFLLKIQLEISRAVNESYKQACKDLTKLEAVFSTHGRPKEYLLQEVSDSYYMALNLYNEDNEVWLDLDAENYSESRKNKIRLLRDSFLGAFKKMQFEENILGRISEEKMEFLMDNFEEFLSGVRKTYDAAICCELVVLAKTYLEEELSLEKLRT
jgi:hypothetical protein